MPRVVFNSPSDLEIEIEVETGTTVLQAAWDNKIDIEGACEGAMACSTCHVVVERKWFDLLEVPTEDEEDMLDLVFGLKVTSRLGCQIIITEKLDGLTVMIPSDTRNILLE